MKSKPSPLVSYAQNGEDVVLARALLPWKNKGFWVDCGAGHPKYDSVTKLFSQFGWTGINIEPLDDEFTLLKQDRPKDENIQCLLGVQEGIGFIYGGPAENRGSSTTDPLLVDRYAKEFGQTFKKFEVPVRRLDAILREKARPTIDFLKIDVEGAEEAVLRGINLKEFHPRILIIEATRPNSTDLCYDTWEPLVLDSGYLFAFFDGLNRYYVNKNDKELLAPLAIPANTLDDYKTFVQLGTEKHNNHLTESNLALNIYVESLTKSIEEKDLYVESLTKSIEEKDLLLADQLQKVINIENRLVTLKLANEALENQLVMLHDVERQLNTIRSYKIFQFLSFSKKLLRRLIH